MASEVYRYSFDPDAPFEEIEASLLLALFSFGSLYGDARVRFEAKHALDAEKKTLAIDAETDLGRDLNRLFTGFIIREFGPDSFDVERPEYPTY